MTNDPPGGRPRLRTTRAYLELIRLPNLPTAMADVAMGFVFVQTVAGPPDRWVLGLLLASSTMLYAAGVVLNDLFDVEADAQQRPERPLPSGRVSPAAASRLGWGLLLLGVVVAMLAAAMVGSLRPAIVAALLAGCVLLYDGYLKRTVLGPPAMGGCRLLNVLLGMSVAAVPWQGEHWLVAGGIGTYVAGVTWFARREAGRSNRAELLAAVGVMMLAVAMLGWLPGWTEITVPARRWHLLLTILGVLIAWQCLRAVFEPSPRRVQTSVKECILSLVVLDAAVGFAAGGPVPAVTIILLLVPAVVLGWWIRST